MTERKPSRRCTHTSVGKAKKAAKKIAQEEDTRELQDFELTWINPDDYRLNQFLLPVVVSPCKK